MSSQTGNPIDTYIIHHLMNEIKFRGTFVEFGCADGVTNSNTWPLEQLGWIGLCIEANPILFEKAQARRRHTVHSLIGEPGQYTFVTMIGDCEQFSGIKELYSTEYLEEYQKCKENEMIVDESAVTTRPLEEILQQYGISDLTYISADCEGCEYSFIKTFNFTAFEVQIFNYEDNTVARQYKAEIDQILHSHGFTLVFEAGDRLFTRKSIIIEA